MSTFARKAVLMCGATALVLLNVPAAWAQTKSFDVPSEEAVNSIPEFARQAGVQIIAPADQLDTLRTDAVKGTFDVRVGLARLLQGTGLEVASSANQTILLRASPRSAAAAPIIPVTLSLAVASGQDVETVTVTGTSIRGVAPIGSNLVSAGRDTMEKIAAINATELTDTIAAITQAGSATQGENAYSYYAPSIHGLGGSASSTTLVIVDGLRMPGGGTQFGQADPNIIPISALQRVEVLADGASSVYGSDAVAGVVNYITRSEFEGLEFGGKVGVGDRWRSDEMDAIAGSSWDRGSMYVAAQYSYQSPLANSARSFLSLGNYFAKGGQNLDTFNCSPATIRTPASGTYVYLSPDATSPVANIAANLPCNNSTYGDALPSAERIAGLVRVNEKVGRLRLTGTVDYGHLTGARALQQGLVTGVTAFGPGSGQGGQVNPFFQAPAGNPAATQETISYQALVPGNNYGIETQANDTLYLYGTADYALSDSWSARLSDAVGHSLSTDNRTGAFCYSCAELGINGTTQANASTTASSVAAANIIALNTPLTSSNALDVWNANGGNTSSAVLKQLYSLNQSNAHWNNFNQSKLEAQGALLDLPAGLLRLATGVEFIWLEQNVTNIVTGGLGATQGLSDYFPFSLARNVYSGYAELVAPLISQEMRIPLVQSFELDLSGRYDHYSDVGATANPKFAANWKIVQGLRLRANYATAFVAPPLAAIGIPAAGYRRSISGATVDTTLINVPLALYPQVASIPGCAAAVVTCAMGGSSAIQGLTRTYGVGPNAKNETGNSWSVGVDFAPSFLAGFTSSITLWNNNYKAGVDSLGVTQQINVPSLNRLTICPTGCTAAQVNAFTNIDNGGILSGTLPSTVYYLRNNDLGNVVNLRVQGIDFDIAYETKTAGMGDFTLGLTGTWLTRFEQDFPGQEYTILGTSGSNNTYPSVQGHARLHGGWQLGNISFDAFVNYTTGYHNWSNTSLIPVITTATGNPVGGGDAVRANTTIDAHVQYAFGDLGMFGNSSAYVNVKNVLDAAPPFYSGNTSGIGLGGNGYNGFLSDPIGRIISLGLRASY